MRPDVTTIADHMNRALSRVAVSIHQNSINDADAFCVAMIDVSMQHLDQTEYDLRNKKMEARNSSQPVHCLTSIEDRTAFAVRRCTWCDTHIRPQVDSQASRRAMLLPLLSEGSAGRVELRLRDEGKAVDRGHDTSYQAMRLVSNTIVAVVMCVKDNVDTDLRLHSAQYNTLHKVLIVLP